MATSVKMEVGQWSKVWHDPMVHGWCVLGACINIRKSLVYCTCVLKEGVIAFPVRKEVDMNRKSTKLPKMLNPIERFFLKGVIV